MPRINGRGINRRNQFREVRILDQGFEWKEDIQAYRLRRQRLENGEFVTLEELGDSETIDTLILKEPNANILIEENGSNINLIGKSNTVERINIGALNKNIALATNRNPQVIKNFDDNIYTIYTTNVDNTNTNTLLFTFDNDFGVDCDGMFARKLILDTDNNADYCRIEIRENNENGQIIYENVSQIAFETGEGDGLVDNEIELRKTFDISCGNEIFWMQIQSNVNITYNGENLTEFKPVLSFFGQEYVKSDLLSNRTNILFEKPTPSVSVLVDDKVNPIIRYINIDEVNMFGQTTLDTMILSDSRLLGGRFQQQITVFFKTSKDETISVTELEFPHTIFQPDVGESAGSNFNFYLDTLAGCDNVRLEIKLNDANGKIIYENVAEEDFKNGLAPSLSSGESKFPLDPPFETAASSLGGNIDIWLKLQFSESVDIKGDYEGLQFFPYWGTDVNLYTLGDIPTLKIWADGTNYSIGDWIYNRDNNKIYECNTNGTQTTSFESNIEKWCVMRGFDRFGEMYFNNNTIATIISVINTWYDITQAISGELLGFSWVNGTLVADAQTKGIFKVDYSLSAASAAANKVFDFAISKNDSISNKTISQTKFISLDVETISGKGFIIDINPGDVIKIETRCLTSATNITVKYGNVNIQQLCD